MKQINISLNTASVSAAIAEVEAYKKSIDTKIHQLIDRLVRNGEEYAIYRLSSHIYTGDTINSVTGYRKGNKGVILVGGAALWLEFGTGVVANACPQGWYPHPLAGYMGMAGIGDYGKGHGADPDGWWYPKDGEWHHTYGIPATQFMYRTFQDLVREEPELAKEIFA